MSKFEKLIKRLKTVPSDFTFDEATKLVCSFGYQIKNKGHTSGSRILFYRPEDGKKILLHKPHPDNVMKGYAVRELLIHLIESGDIKEE